MDHVEMKVEQNHELSFGSFGNNGESGVPL